MTVRLTVDGVTGKVAVYDYTAGNDAPFTDPMGNIGRVHFHSDLPAIKIIWTQTGSVALGELLSSSNYNGSNPSTFYPGLSEEKVLFAHGQAGIPYVEGRITSLNGSAVSIPLAGSVPIQRVHGFPRWLHLGANSTNVVLNSFVNGSIFGDYPAITVGYEIYLTDLLL